jgi:flagellar assembly protein FliH
MVLKRQSIAFSEEPRAIGLAGLDLRAGYFEDELKGIRESAYSEGYSKASSECAAEIADLKEMMTALQEGVLQTVIEKQRALSSHIRSILPVLVTEAAERVLAGVKIDESAVKAVIGDLMAEVSPGIENVEIRLNAEDHSKLQMFDPSFGGRYPQARLIVDLDLAEGDCVIKSRFGTLDGRIATKLRALEGALS